MKWTHTHTLLLFTSDWGKNIKLIQMHSIGFPFQYLFSQFFRFKSYWWNKAYSSIYNQCVWYELIRCKSTIPNYFTEIFSDDDDVKMGWKTIECIEFNDGINEFHILFCNTRIFKYFYWKSSISFM